MTTIQSINSPSVSKSLKSWSVEDRSCHIWQNRNCRVSLTQERSSEGRRHWAQKHLVTYRTKHRSTTQVSNTRRCSDGSKTKVKKETRNNGGVQQKRAWVNKQIVTFHALHAGYIFFCLFTRQAINIVVIMAIIHAQLIHIHSRQEQYCPHTRVKCTGIQTHLPFTNTPPIASWDVTFRASGGELLSRHPRVREQTEKANTTTRAERVIQTSDVLRTLEERLYCLD